MSVKNLLSLSSQNWLRTFVVVFAAGLVNVAASQQSFDNAFVSTQLQRAIEKPDTQVNIQVNAPMSQVFSTLLNNVHDYSDSAVAIEFDHSNSDVLNSLGIGSERITHMEDGKILVQRILQLNEPTSFAYFTDMQKSTVDVPIAYTVGHYQLTQIDDELVEAQVSVAYQPKSRLTGFIVRRIFNSAVKKDFQKAELLLNTPQ